MHGPKYPIAVKEEPKEDSGAGLVTAVPKGEAANQPKEVPSSHKGPAADEDAKRTGKKKRKESTSSSESTSRPTKNVAQMLKFTVHVSIPENFKVYTL